MKSLPVVLLVDDHQEIIEFLWAILEEEYTLLMASNGYQAISILRQQTVDLVVSDVMMPQMDGFTLCKTIKADQDISHVPVILLTAKNTLEAKVQGLDVGADAYIDKPFSGAHLRAQIKNLLSSRTQLRALFASQPSVPAQTLAHTRSDARFIQRLTEFILVHIDEEEMSTGQMAEAMNTSRITLYRKLKSLTGLSPHEFINATRLKKAAMMLETGEFRIFEVALSVGYKSTTHFGKVFTRQFGMSPSQFVDSGKVKK